MIQQYIKVNADVTKPAALRIPAGMNPPKVAQLDLTKYCRHSDKLITTVELEVNSERVPWLKLGECEIASRREGTIWMFRSYLLNCTDGEHDSSQIVRFEVVGLQYEMTMYGQSYFNAWMRADDPDDFRVPTPDYDPLKGATKCKDCKGKDAHMFADYLPPRNEDLFEMVRGCKVRIVTGLKHK